MRSLHDITIRRVCFDDIEQLRLWRNDPRINYLFRHTAHITMDFQAKWFERVSAADSTDLMYAILDDGVLIGCCGLCHRDGGAAEISVYVEPDTYMFGPEAERAVHLLIANAELEHGLNTVRGEVYKNSKARLEFFKRCGFEVTSESSRSWFIRRILHGN